MKTAGKTKVTVGVCGGVAAYRAVELVRALQDAGLDPHVVMTAGAEEFVRPLTFAAVSGHRVITSLWSGGEVPGGDSSVEHIEEAQTTDALVIVPATANVIAKLANGFADDFLTTMYLATPAPVIVAPAMNVVMWEHPAVQANVALLRDRSDIVVEPGAGYLACGMQGSGRLADLAAIVNAVQEGLKAAQGYALEGQDDALGDAGDLDLEDAGDLAGETILITAGGTREPIDLVRFIGNRSSGRMGYALAAEARERGAKVILVTTTNALPNVPGVMMVPVETAEEMLAAVLAHLPEATVVLKAAAVADFRMAQMAAGKIHREGALTLELAATEDIVAEVVKRRRFGTLVVAFAAEVSDPVGRGRQKMQRKGVDAIVINDVSIPGLGFDGDRNAATMLAGERVVVIPEMSKREMAVHVLDEVVRMRRFTTVSEKA